ncbi:MAG: DUF4149 domain-containing protein [Campylobacter lanienae]|uniref:DUF4149 domain-containing protein n=1 Tax=Campylobacter lanienae TaxID=75658 RepID=UPI002A91907D|nr:DUF4149 domain-containing protein [Campylobacter lanienae]MDY5519747.1 DUF4149 domain-containing protein [Campylobacter lanienae]MDY6057059.1 DUF4149 domain-containing protein [Campylobacter lanienae]
MVKFRSFYLFLLGICIGAELAIGIFMAPVIFYPSQYIGEGVLSHYQSGQLMTQVFLKYNILLIFISSLILLFEIVNLKGSESFNYKISAFFLSLIIALLAMSFVFYFTPYILQAQKIGAEATATAEFLSMHKASEFVMKAMLLAQVALFFIRARKES